MEHFYPELIPHASTCKSPMSMLSALLKTYYAEKSGHRPEEDLRGGVMPCTAKKFEARRPEHYDAVRRALHRRRAHHARADLDDQVPAASTSGTCRTASSTPRWASPPARPTSSARPAA